MPDQTTSRVKKALAGYAAKAREARLQAVKGGQEAEQRWQDALFDSHFAAVLDQPGVALALAQAKAAAALHAEYWALHVLSSQELSKDESDQSPQKAAERQAREASVQAQTAAIEKAVLALTHGDEVMAAEHRDLHHRINMSFETNRSVRAAVECAQKQWHAVEKSAQRILVLSSQGNPTEADVQAVETAWSNLQDRQKEAASSLQTVYKVADKCFPKTLTEVYAEMQMYTAQ